MIDSSIVNTPRFQQRLAEERAEIAERERQQALAIEQRNREAEAYMRERKAEETAEREQKRREAEARLDAELAPARMREQRAWLANHPSRTDADFEKVWREHLRPNAIDERERQAAAISAEALRASGNYRV